MAKHSEGSNLHPISDLYLDNMNPRLGTKAGGLKITDQVKILDAVVDTFGVDDVLSSLAVNGYFDAEPVVGIREKQNGKDIIRVREGNRRLAACLILAGDDRAKNQERKTTEFQALQQESKKPPIIHIPVILHKDDNNLLSYLGVRHIASQLPWDSYAKVAWVAQVVESGNLSVKQVSEMIGDQHNTIPKTLEGYYFVNQLIDKGYFNPKDSFKRGRGSNPEFPFSWVYTALGFRAIRDWLELEDYDEAPSKTPVKENRKHLEEASYLLRFLFGNQSESIHPIIKDSREISELAKCVGDRESLSYLKKGKMLSEVQQLNKPADQQIEEGLVDARDALESTLPPLSANAITEDDARELSEISKKVRSLALDVHKRIRTIAVGEDEED